MNHIHRILFILFISFGTLTPVAVTQASESITLSNLADAKSGFEKIGGNMKAIAWYILLVMVIIAGVMAAFGQQKMAIGVFIGALIIAGGTYLIGVIANANSASVLPKAPASMIAKVSKDARLIS